MEDEAEPGGRPEDSQEDHYEDEYVEDDPTPVAQLENAMDDLDLRIEASGSGNLAQLG